MKIHTEQGRFFTGLGDTIALTWLAEGSKATKDPISLVCHDKQRASLIRLLGQEPTQDARGALLPSDLYPLELQDRCAKPRLDYALEYFKRKDITPKRPKYNPTPEGETFAQEVLTNFKGNADKLVVLFPQTHWTAREYPAPYWLWLQSNMRRQNIACAMMLDYRCNPSYKPKPGQKPRDERYRGSSAYWFDQPFDYLASMMQVADLVVGNDSMPAHLAGALGCKCLALMGPTKPNVFAHCSDVVECLTSTKDCTGCHFNPVVCGRWCNQGCASLMQLTPETVLEKILSIIHKA